MSDTPTGTPAGTTVDVPATLNLGELTLLEMVQIHQSLQMAFQFGAVDVLPLERRIEELRAELIAKYGADALTTVTTEQYDTVQPQAEAMLEELRSEAGAELAQSEGI